MVDENRVRRLLGMLERYRALLAVDDPDPYRRRHLVQTAAQICIDLANHVIAADGHRVPRDYGDAFRVLAEVGVLDDGLADRLVALAGTRNLIVHLSTPRWTMTGSPEPSGTADWTISARSPPGSRRSPPHSDGLG